MTQDEHPGGVDRRIAVVGLGYVGLPLAVAFAESGTEVAGLDVNPARVEELRAGSVPHRGHPAMRGSRRPSLAGSAPSARTPRPSGTSTRSSSACPRP